MTDKIDDQLVQLSYTTYGTSNQISKTETKTHCRCPTNLHLSSMCLN